MDGGEFLKQSIYSAAPADWAKNKTEVISNLILQTTTIVSFFLIPGTCDKLNKY